MKNNWKESFKALFDSHNEDERYAEMYFEFIESLLAEQKKELMEEIKKNLLDTTKGIDDGGNVYVASQIDYVDIENLFKRYD